MKAVHALGFIGFTAFSVRGQAALYAQCGGNGWTGATTCVNGADCNYKNDYYSQCLPASATTNTASTCGASPPASAGKLKYAGVNMAGFDFGTDTNGDSSASSAYPPLPQYGGNGPAQMAHFVKNDNYNIFRLPVSWQFLTDNVATGTLNQAYFTEYDTLVQACLATGASCVIDIHNYARWYGAIIGQGGPSNDVFASLWNSLASHYASESRILFGIMNEPHDLPSITLWAQTVQAAVTAIRNAGATTQTILIPGDHYSSAETFVSGGSAEALSVVTNPDGSHTNLVFDVHKYLDSDSSGTSDTCVTNNIAEAWEPLSQWLRCNGRQALNTETGGGNTASCEEYMCQQIQYMAENSDVILGYCGWSAGNFASTYALSETPSENGGTWIDQPLVNKCMAPSVNNLLA
ncbi:carbohydrate-binding module family 1 protein/Glycoside hydrolase family 5 protein [Boletus edulis]|uniref:cellulase n=1 Tax=Boletus edulis BED1 TaxID=1328754 RepID=A0AAD4GA80_BOLED|nr:carbohydrate-binding module family 1 protein/Glycoside hydrolase family 5 protein [Boletus edulis]KAF8432658.1 carbohydrate-binding module family 1 protein/Glycoside hydrolase family 5 protein [Boletus edulis BED1]